MITIDYDDYAVGQKDWADNLNRTAESHDQLERNEAALAAIHRMMTLSGRHPLTDTND